MGCCPHCDGLDRLFDRSNADKDLKNYLNNGPDKGTRVLIGALRESGVAGLTLLDIGGGIGAIHHELFKDGVTRVVDVDVSRAYVEVAREEDMRRGYPDRVDYRRGDFVALAPEIDPADVVTLDRVICCYPDMPALVGLSAARARRYYGLVYPRRAWWMRLARVGLNGWMRLLRNPYRFFLHPPADVDSILRRNGFQRRFHRLTWLWEVAVYARAGA